MPVILALKSTTELKCLSLGTNDTNDIGTFLLLLKPTSLHGFGIGRHFDVVFSKSDEYVIKGVGRGFFSWFAFRGTSPGQGAFDAISVSCKVGFLRQASLYRPSWKWTR